MNVLFHQFVQLSDAPNVAFLEPSFTFAVLSDFYAKNRITIKMIFFQRKMAYVICLQKIIKTLEYLFPLFEIYETIFEIEY